MINLSVTVDDYVNMIESRKWFAQANYGDGEWQCILGHEGQNCNGEKYTKQFSQQLRSTLVEPDRGVWCGTIPDTWWTDRTTNLLDRIAQFKKTHNIERCWLDKHILVHASTHGTLGPFIKCLRSRRVIIVGPWWLGGLLTRGVFTPQHHEVVHPSDAFARVDEHVLNICERQKATAADIVLFCAGMASNVMIWRLASATRTSLLDCGSLWDPFVGVWSRKNYKKPEIQAKIRENL